jgi:porin
MFVSKGRISRSGVSDWMQPSSVVLVLLLPLLGGIANAQDTSSPVLSGKATNIKSAHAHENQSDTKPAAAPVERTTSDVSQAPVQLRPFILTLPRDHLLGDWGGLLPKMEDTGITPTLTYVSDIAGNPTGGKSQGISYDDNIGLGLEFDLNKLAGLDGGSLLISMSERDGDSLSKKYVGNVFSVQQVYGGETFHLVDVAYQQKLFDDRVELSLGRIAAGDDFLVSAYDYLFMQNGFDGNPVAIFDNSLGMNSYPNATWGTRIKVMPTKRTYLMAGVYNGDAAIRHNDDHGADFSMNGPVFAIAEAGYKYNGLPGDFQLLGNYKVGAWYDHNSFTDYTTLGYTQPASLTKDNWGCYGMFDQVLVPFADPTSNRGLGIFGSVLVSPDQSISEIPYFFTAGVAARGIFASRPADIAGFGAVFGEFSSDLRDAEQREQLLDPTVGVQSHETVLEGTYRFSMSKGALFFQPDIQYVIRPAGTGQLSNAVVLGCQLGVNF